ncbi:MAG: hypothetical protein VX970_05530 [Planctomycetota bacterium]|nr:hypothetical protein [Planctomycetota bacterium]
MKHTSLLCLALALSFTAVGEADESNEFDREDRRPAQGETQRHGAQLPPPLRIFDKNRDNALSPEEIQDLAERLQQLDRDGDGKIGPRELEGVFSPPRPRRRGDDRFDRGPDERGRRGPPGRGDDRFEDDEFDDRFDRGPGERGRRGPPGRGDDRFEDDGFNDRFNRRPPSIQRSGPDGRPPRATNGGDSGVQWLVDRLYQFDANDDGKLSKDELPNRAKRLVEQADRDQDGMIDRAELEQFLLNR